MTAQIAERLMIQPAIAVHRGGMVAAISPIDTGPETDRWLTRQAQGDLVSGCPHEIPS